MPRNIKKSKLKDGAVYAFHKKEIKTAGEVALEKMKQLEAEKESSMRTIRTRTGTIRTNKTDSDLEEHITTIEAKIR